MRQIFYIKANKLTYSHLFMSSIYRGVCSRYCYYRLEKEKRFPYLSCLNSRYITQKDSQLGFEVGVDCLGIIIRWNGIPGE